MPDGMEGYTDDAPEEQSTEEQRPMTEDGTPEDSGETMHVPSTFLQGTKFNEGDELVLKVVSVDDEGLEVAYAKAPPSEGDNSAHSELDQLDQNPTY